MMELATLTNSGGTNNIFNQDYIIGDKNYIVCCDGHGKQRIKKDGTVQILNTGGLSAKVVSNYIAKNIDRSKKIVFQESHQVLMKKLRDYLDKQELETKILNKRILQHLDYHNNWKNTIGGTTATTVVYNETDKTVEVANVGDCQAVLFDEVNSHKILTADHSPHSISEYKLLKDKFNFLYGARSYRRIDFSTPLYDEFDNLNPVPKRCIVKNAEKIPYVIISPKESHSGLNMTRSIGDFWLSAKGISQEAEVSYHQIIPGQVILVGSDGFFDNYIMRDLSIFMKENMDLTANELVNKLMEDALNRQKERYHNSGDNLSIGVMVFR